MPHPSYGPFSPAEFAELQAKPAGHFADAVRRRHDPWWGREEDTPFPWRVRFVRTTTEEAFLTVFATSEEDAAAQTEGYPLNQLQWDWITSGNAVIAEIVPEGRT